MHQELPSKAQDNTAERGTRVKVTEAEVRVEELSLVRDHEAPSY